MSKHDDQPLHWAIKLRRILLIGYAQGTKREDLEKRIDKHNAFLRDVTAAMEMTDSKYFEPSGHCVKLINEYFDKHISTPNEDNLIPEPIKIPIVWKDAEAYLMHTKIVYKSERDGFLRVNGTRDTGIYSTKQLVNDVQKFAEQFATEFAVFYANQLEIFGEATSIEAALSKFKSQKL